LSRKLIAIVGQTATGKTALAVDLARRLGGEIIGADSRQVYRHMEIGTARPTAAERGTVPHHLIDVADPDEPFSLGRWLELAHQALDQIWARDRQPFLVGGTGQYVWALLEGWQVPRVPPQPPLRRELEAKPADALVEELMRADPESAARIDPRNLRRVIRALEVYRSTGKPLSHWRTRNPPPLDALIIGLSAPRQELHRRIDRRVDAMMEAGLVEEVRRLRAMGHQPDLPSMSGIGYREICEHLAGDTDHATAVARIKTGTHRLARHQHSWFKMDDPRIHWLPAGDDASTGAARLVEEWLGVAKAAQA
jgi:tRNA dimethylallyltransferase